MAENTLRKRTKPSIQNGSKTLQEVKQDDPEFMIRESPLTILMHTSAHIRAIYHIFVVILVMLLCDTAIYDLVESGK